MSKKSLWLWKLYLIFLIFGSIKKVMYMHHPKSHVAFYFDILVHLDSYFLTDFFCNIIQVHLNLFMCLPVFLFIYRYRPTKIYPWRVLFVIKLLFDGFGNSFQLHEFKSMYYHSPMMCYTYFLSSISLFVPAMFIWYLYAFHTDRVIPANARLTPKFL